MQSRRNFIGKVATGLAGTLAASNVLGANDRIRLGIIGPGDRGSEILREAMACPNVECVGAADIYTAPPGRRRSKIAPNAKTYLDYRHLLDDKIDRRGPDRHAAAPALRALHRRARRRQARLPGKDDGVHGGPRQAHARRLPASAGKRTVQIGHQWTARTGQVADAHQLPQAGTDGQDHRDPRAHVPQYAARQAAVVAAGLSRT